MKTLADRFRQWYEHERDSNAKSLEMLQSVPAERRTDPLFQKALDKMAHLVAARRRWLTRLGITTELPDIFPTGQLDELPALVAATEAQWVNYLAKLDDDALVKPFEWVWNGQRMRWTLEGILTQVNGHAWYHRGQIAMLVSMVGGKMVDTDYVFFCKPEKLGPAE
ncbi:MAG: DinB family protein [Gemmataceae bacterium]